MSKLKITWIIFGLLIFMNGPLFVLGQYDIFDFWPLYQIPLWQIAWLWGFAGQMGLDVFGKTNEFISQPNFLGGIFIVVGTLVSLFVNYLIARVIVLAFGLGTRSESSN